MKRWIRKWLGIIDLNTEAIKALGDSNILTHNDRIAVLEARITGLLNYFNELTDSTNKLGDVVNDNSKEIAKINAGLSVIVKNLQAQADKKADSQK